MIWTRLPPTSKPAISLRGATIMWPVEAAEANQKKADYAFFFFFICDGCV